MVKMYDLNLALFDGAPNTNVTTQTGSGKDLSPEMKTFYDKTLITLAEGSLVHDQFAQKKPIPKNGGKTIEFRKFNQLPKLTTPLTEGVTPDGQSISVTKQEATVSQYGGYATLSDMLELTAIDNIIVEATKAIASQAGRSLDTITREVLCGGTNVVYSGGKSARSALDATCVIKAADIKKAKTILERQDAPMIGDSYVCIIHPDVASDLMDDPKWVDADNYQQKGNLFKGEIGMLYGVRFVKSTNAKIFGGAGASGLNVYATIVLGEGAYGTTEIEGGGLQHFVKQKGSGGTTDPIDQRSTVGWKATKVTERLIEQYMVRIESTSTYNGDAN